MRASLCVAVWDHPRTRGVYLTPRRAGTQPAGSSPHTRGLPRWSLTPAGDSRIIPAHAGFTLSQLGGGQAGQDHPRTRGVYVAVTPATGAGAGSSPHTRGLQLGDGVTIMGDRIIPAHAGFTAYRPPAHASAQDHPRTRGVYLTPSRTVSFRAGSSPHTRGLPERDRHHIGLVRIIPAHAGFTDRPPADRSGTADHPRTRGVYAVGLTQGHVSPGIIPAHAGFTAPAPTHPPWAADHPRTRGVYVRVCACARRCAGSSPHTRGLRSAPPRASGAPRIIPAHAGFTSSPTIIVGRWRDHPRTRGVYPPSWVGGGDSWGSSPHTRGLRRGAVGG